MCGSFNSATDQAPLLNNGLFDHIDSFTLAENKVPLVDDTTSSKIDEEREGGAKEGDDTKMTDVEASKLKAQWAEFNSAMIQAQKIEFASAVMKSVPKLASPRRSGVRRGNEQIQATDKCKIMAVPTKSYDGPSSTGAACLPTKKQRCPPAA